MTDESNGNGVGLERPKEVSDALSAVAKARVTEAMLVIVVCVASLGLIATTAWNTYRLQRFSQQQVKAQDFGLKAIQCILGNFAEHRFTNQQVHDDIARKLGVPPTPHTPLPERMSEGQFHAACDLFGTVAFREGDGSATTSTTRK